MALFEDVDQRHERELQWVLFNVLTDATFVPAGTLFSIVVKEWGPFFMFPCEQNNVIGVSSSIEISENYQETKSCAFR